MPRLSRRNVRKGGKRRVRRGGDDDEEKENKEFEIDGLDTTGRRR